MRATLVIALTLAASSAAAEPGQHGSAGFELRLHRGDTEQDEVAHYGFYPSIVVDGSVQVGGGIEIAAAVAAAKVSAVWENCDPLSDESVKFCSLSLTTRAPPVPVKSMSCAVPASGVGNTGPICVAAPASVIR